jgi:hypothetical protein
VRATVKLATGRIATPPNEKPPNIKSSGGRKVPSRRRYLAPAAHAELSTLDGDVCSSLIEIAQAEKTSKGHVSRIPRLAPLAPDLVEAILGGWRDQRVMLERLERPLPVGWGEQRAQVQGG